MIDDIKDPLWEYGAFKDILQTLFMNNDNIVKLVMPELDNKNFTFEQNWIGGTYLFDKKGNKAKETLIGHCFTHPFIEDTVTDSRSFICMETLGRISNDHIKKIVIQIFAYSHHSILQMDYEERQQFIKQGFGGNRCDMIMMAINRCLMDENISKKFGIGKINLSNYVNYPISTNVPNNKYYSRYLTYEVSDFYITPKIMEEYLS